MQSLYHKELFEQKFGMKSVDFHIKFYTCDITYIFSITKNKNPW